MWKYTVEVEGMMCSMCESHINDAVRRSLPVKKVSSSRSRHRTVVLSEEELDGERLREVINATGYRAGGVVKERAEKKKKWFRK